jgi:hypothetical protein
MEYAWRPNHEQPWIYGRVRRRARLRPLSKQPGGPGVLHGGGTFFDKIGPTEGGRDQTGPVSRRLLLRSVTQEPILQLAIDDFR